MGLPGQQRHLADDLPRPQARQLVGVPQAVARAHADRAAAHDVQLAAQLPLLQQDRAGREAARPQPLLHRLLFGGGEAREEPRLSPSDHAGSTPDA